MGFLSVGNLVCPGNSGSLFTSVCKVTSGSFDAVNEIVGPVLQWAGRGGSCIGGTAVRGAPVRGAAVPAEPQDQWLGPGCTMADSVRSSVCWKLENNFVFLTYFTYL